MSSDVGRGPNAMMIYRQTGNLGAARVLLGHSKIECTVRPLGNEVDDAIEIAGNIDTLSSTQSLRFLTVSAAPLRHRSTFAR